MALSHTLSACERKTGQQSARLIERRHTWHIVMAISRAACRGRRAASGHRGCGHWELTSETRTSFKAASKDIVWIRHAGASEQHMQHRDGTCQHGD
eukprot:97641-Rhodomonas_salina.1